MSEPIDDIKALCDRVRQTAYDVHAYLANGHLEKVYENALAHRLRKSGFEVEQQFPLRVTDEDGTVLGEYVADLIVNRQLIVEVKAAKAIGPEHEAQILGYLKSARMKHGMVINFGAYRFEIRKYVWTENPMKPPSDVQLAPRDAGTATQAMV